MIKAESFQKQWLDSHRKKKGYERINPPLVEKMINALSLVEQLVLQGLEQTTTRTTFLLASYA